VGHQGTGERIQADDLTEESGGREQQQRSLSTRAHSVKQAKNIIPS
jgi:hypothetical protein